MYYYDTVSKKLISDDMFIGDTTTLIVISNIPEHDPYIEDIYINDIIPSEDGTYTADFTVVPLPEIVQTQNFLKAQLTAIQAIDKYTNNSIYEGFDIVLPIDNIPTQLHFKYDQYNQIRITDNIAITMIDKLLSQTESVITVFGYKDYTGVNTGTLIPVVLNRMMSIQLFMTAVTFKQKMMIQAQHHKSQIESCHSAKEIMDYLSTHQIPL